MLFRSSSDEPVKAELPLPGFDMIAIKGIPFKQVVEDFEKSLITRALIATKGNRTEAAKLLKIHRRHLYTKINDYKINIS